MVSVHGSIAETSALTKQSMVRFGRYNYGLLRQALKGLPRNDGIGATLDSRYNDSASPCRARESLSIFIYTVYHPYQNACVQQVLLVL